MISPMDSSSDNDLFIVDNSNGEWKVRSYLREWCDLSSAIDIATGYFEIGALLALEDRWKQVDKIRILMGDEVSLRTKRAFESALQALLERLDQSLESEKKKNDFLEGVPAIVEALVAKLRAADFFMKAPIDGAAFLNQFPITSLPFVSTAGRGAVPSGTAPAFFRGRFSMTQRQTASCP